MEKFFTVLLLALLLDYLVGDPPWLWRRVPHPVVLCGRIISLIETPANHAGLPPERRFLHGWIVIAVLLILSAMTGLLLAEICKSQGIAGLLAEVAFVAVFLARKSLADHVMAVHDALIAGGIEGGRRAVSMIVGRDPQALDENGICRAAIESLAENSSDGIIAPALWYLLLGLPGLFAYKMLNTADSMIGHKNARYAAFGFAAARLDDAANYIPARLTGALTVLAVLFVYGGKQAKRTWQVMLRDAPHHRSLNAGWPESAFAGALDIRLAGPRCYGAEKADEPFLNAGGRDPDLHMLRQAMRLFRALMHVFTAVVAIATLVCSLRTLCGIFS